MHTSITIGPNINDLFGNRMDQNSNGLQGELSDSYLTSFYVASVFDANTGTMTFNKTSLSTDPTYRSVDAFFMAF